MSVFEGPLGRKTPTDWRHVEKYPLRALATAPTVPDVVEKRLDLPTQYVDWYDQGNEGACVGFALSWMMSILNRRKYSARKLYRAAQDQDEWSDTPPEEGTSVRAGCDVLRQMGHWRFFRGIERALGMMEGISTVRWARTIDELRACIAEDIPFVSGVNWYSAFDNPIELRGPYGQKEWWIGVDGHGKVLKYLGYIRGGHAIASYHASDKRQAVKDVNTWGKRSPRIWIPYEIQQRLLNEDGECCLVTDR